MKSLPELLRNRELSPVRAVELRGTLRCREMLRAWRLHAEGTMFLAHLVTMCSDAN